MAFIPVCPVGGRTSLPATQRAHFRGNGRRHKEGARVDELERLLGQLYAEDELLKKSLVCVGAEGLRGASKVEAGTRYMIIQESLSNGLILPTCRACKALEVSRSEYYKWMNRHGDEVSQNGAELDLRNQILDIAREFPGYGYRRVTIELRTRGYSTNHKHALRLMREDNLLCSKR